MRNDILLFVNGQQHRVTGADAFLTLSDFLRRRLKLCGTKIVCSEGDCGSCSVLCGRVDQDEPDRFNYVPIDSCIRFVFQLDGCHVVTVEGLAGQPNADRRELSLNRVQRAMIDCHGSQCGFCTPGFVVVMTGLLEEIERPIESQWRTGLTGNLCRCTGYSPILSAGQQCHAGNTPPLNELYPAAQLIEIVLATENDEILVDASSDGEPARTVYAPTSMEQAVSFLAKNPTAKIVAGATDIGVQFNKGVARPSVWLDLNRISSLAELEIAENKIVCGARATWTECNKLIQQQVPQLAEIISVFGGPQIRHVGTIGGNIINASPIADSLPFLFVREAELELVSESGSRTVNINDFYLGYKKLDLQPGELLSRITIPLPSSDSELQLFKVSRRRDLDISSFTAAIQITRDGDNITEAAIAYGAVGPTVLRMRQTEVFLRGRSFTLDTMKAAGEIAETEITPLTDVRGSESYRLQLAKNVLLKFFYQSNAKQLSI